MGMGRLCVSAEKGHSPYQYMIGFPVSELHTTTTLLLHSGAFTNYVMLERGRERGDTKCDDVHQCIISMGY